MRNVCALLLLFAVASWASATPTTIFEQSFEAGTLNPGGADSMTVLNTTPYPTGVVPITATAPFYGWKSLTNLGTPNLGGNTIVQDAAYSGTNSMRILSSRLRTDIPHVWAQDRLYKMTFKYMINDAVNNDQTLSITPFFKIQYPTAVDYLPNTPQYQLTDLVDNTWYTYTLVLDTTGRDMKSGTGMRIVNVLGWLPESNEGAYIDDWKITYEPYPDPISGVSVQRQSSFYTPDDRSAVHTIDGSGFNPTTHEHTNNPAGTMWLTNGAVANEYVDYDLGGWYDLEAVQYWAYNELTFGGIRSILNSYLSVAKDDITYVQSGPMRTWAAGPGSSTGNFSQFDMLPATQVRFVKLKVATNNGAGDVGLSEIRFFGTHSATPPYVEFTGAANNNYGNTGNWAEYDSSYATPNTNAVPAGTQVVEVVTTGAASPVVNSVVPDVNVVFVGEWFGNVAGPAAGMLTIENGGLMVVTEQLNVGRWGSALPKSHVQINGGYLYAKYLELNWNGSSSDVDIDGGMLEIGDWHPGGNIDLKHNGVLVIAGDVTASIPAWITDGKLSAYDGTGTLLYDYNVTNAGKTTIWANSDVARLLTFVSPPPTDGLKLSWTAADTAVTHNVYLGYTYDSVLNATTASPECIATGLTASSFTTRSFNFYPPAVTLYWRIDEVDSSGVAHASPVQVNQIGWTWMDDFEHYGTGKDTFTNWWMGTGGATVALASNMYGSGALEFDYNNAGGDSEAVLDFTSANVWGRTQNLTMGNQSTMDVSFKTWDYVNDHAVEVSAIGECSLDWASGGWTVDPNWAAAMYGWAGNPCQYNELILTWDPVSNGLKQGMVRSPNFTITGDVVRFWFNGVAGDPNIYVELVRASDNMQLKKTSMPFSSANFVQYNWDVRAYQGTEVFFRAVDNSTAGWLGLARVAQATVAFPKLYLKFEDNASHIAKVDLDPAFVYPYPGGTAATWLQGYSNSIKWWPVSYASISAANPSIDLTHIKKFAVGYGDGTASGATGKFYFDELTLHIARCEGLGQLLGDLNADCFVNISDLETMATQWLAADGTADIVDPTTSNVNLADFAALSSNWLDNDMWPTPWVGPVAP